MKKIILLLLFITIFAFIGVRLAAFSALRLPQQAHKALSSVQVVTPTPSLGQPMTLRIPKLNIQAPIESVGLTSTGRMDVPKTVGGTGWYAYGPKPGEVGNAVIDGHFDTPTGAPSVFYYIGNLHPGDTIQVVTTHHQTLTFTVTKVTSFPDNGFPIEEVFGASSSKNLNLITCSGMWDRTAHNYSNRTVIFSTLQ